MADDMMLTSDPLPSVCEEVYERLMLRKDSPGGAGTDFILTPPSRVAACSLEWAQHTQDSH